MSEYDPTTKYAGYDKVRKHGTDEDPRPWDFMQEVSAIISSNDRVLDAGCGTAFKLPLLNEMGAKERGVIFTGFDINRTQLAKARSTVGEGNIHLLCADILPKEGGFPFTNNSFDVVAFMLSKHNAREAHRVLKPGGRMIMERVGELEKREAKLFFGNDENGQPRGYLTNHEPGSLMPRYKSDFVEAGFSEVHAQEGTWITRYTPNGLRTLLENSPFVRGYDAEADKPIVDQIIADLTKAEHGKVELPQHRILITASK